MWIHENGRQYLFLAAEFIPILVAELTVERNIINIPRRPIQREVHRNVLNQL
jgi:hypothetical protein